MQPDLMIDGQCFDVKSVTLSFPDRPIMPTKPAAFCVGQFEVSGNMTAYFSNDALLAAILGKPHKASVWKVLRPKLYRYAAYALAALGASFIVIAGAL
jgi:hypothetical protein